MRTNDYWFIGVVFATAVVFYELAPLSVGGATNRSHGRRPRLAQQRARPR